MSADNSALWAAPVVMLAMAVWRNVVAGRSAGAPSVPADDGRWLTAKQRAGVPHSEWTVDDWEHYYTAQRMKQEWLHQQHRRSESVF